MANSRGSLGVHAEHSSARRSPQHRRAEGNPQRRGAVGWAGWNGAAHHQATWRNQGAGEPARSMAIDVRRGRIWPILASASNNRSARPCTRAAYASDQAERQPHRPDRIGRRTPMKWRLNFRCPTMQKPPVANLYSWAEPKLEV